MLVAVPFAKGKARIYFRKGRAWSLVEHLVLEVLTRKMLTIRELAAGFHLPRRVVTECLIRLMRVDWLHMTQSNGELKFEATLAGQRAVDSDELPTASRNMSRAPTYYYDRLVGHVFRNRGLRAMDRESIEKRFAGRSLHWIEPKRRDLQFDASEFASVMLDDDERLINVDHPTENWTNKFLIVTVHGETVTGLPDGDYPSLRLAILAEVAGKESSGEREDGRRDNAVAYSRRAPVPELHKIAFDSSDLVLGGPAHLRVLEDMLRAAKSRVIIHSTFISEEKVLKLLPLLREAVHRGVRIDILWGQDDDRDGNRKSGAEIARDLSKHSELSRLDGLLIHPFSTKSHSKWVLADCEAQGDFGLAIGSCNWLSSGFFRAEASVRLRDAGIICEFMELAADLTCAHNGLWNSLTNELLQLAGMIRPSSSSRNGAASAALVVDAQHSHFLLRARDEARKRIFLSSHRLGPASWPGVLVPIMEACRSGTLRAEVHYGRFDGITRVAESQWAAEARACDVNVVPTELDGLHAKVLAWDENAVLVSSLNWLSAHPTEFRAAREIGVWIEAPGVSSAVISALTTKPS
jgi:hypothetical protein